MSREWIRAGAKGARTNRSRRLERAFELRGVQGDLPEDDREGPTKAKMAEKTAETNAGREERPEIGSEEETSRDYSTGSEGTMGDVQATEEERIAQAIDGKGEFLSDELKKLLREIEVVQGLRAGALGEEIEARLRGVTEPSRSVSIPC